MARTHHSQAKQDVAANQQFVLGCSVGIHMDDCTYKSISSQDQHTTTNNTHTHSLSYSNRATTIKSALLLCLLSSVSKGRHGLLGRAHPRYSTCTTTDGGASWLVLGLEHELYGVILGVGVPVGPEWGGVVIVGGGSSIDIQAWNFEGDGFVGFGGHQ